MERARITAFPTLAELPAQELDELASALREVDIPEGATVVTVDDYGDAVYFVEQGTAEVLNEGEPAQTLGAGDTEQTLRRLGLERASR